jgi:hypothetical protein
MTKENFRANFGPISMPQPFAHGGTITEIGVTQDANSINFIDGFPSVYSAPKSNNGKFVTRGEINAIGNLASRNDFHRRCGGLNTFDPSFASAIGGYPRGAILQLFERGTIFYVESLVDNNLINFLEVGVDDVHWRYCYESTYQSLQERFIGSVKADDIAASSASSINIFARQSPVSGYITIRNVKFSHTIDTIVGGSGNILVGAAIVARSFSPDNIASYSPITPGVAPNNAACLYTLDSATVTSGSKIWEFPAASSVAAGTLTANYTIPQGLISVSAGDYIFIDIINGLIGAAGRFVTGTQKYVLEYITAGERNVSFDIYVI